MKRGIFVMKEFLENECAEIENDKLIWDDSLSRWKIDITDYIKKFFGETIKKAYVLCMEDSSIENAKQDAFYLYETIESTIEDKLIEFDTIDLLITLPNGRTIEIWNADNSLTIEDFDIRLGKYIN